MGKQMFADYKRKGFWEKAHFDPLLLIVLLAVAFRLLVINRYGLTMTLNSDDEHYVASAMALLRTGVYVYQSPLAPEFISTVLVMPGMTLLLAGVYSIFGTGYDGKLAATVVMILIGSAGVYGIGAVGRKIWNKWVGYGAALMMALALPHVLTDNLMLSEAPFRTALIFLVLFTLRYGVSWHRGDLAGVLLCFIIALYFKPVILPYGILFFVYMGVKGMPLPRLGRDALLSAVIIMVALSPWVIRNYQVTNGDIIFLTKGSGKIMLRGTFQGVGYPETGLDFEQTLTKLDKQATNSVEKMELYKAEAKARRGEWLREHPFQFIYSHVVVKPLLLWRDAFYWIRIFQVERDFIYSLQKWVVGLGFFGLVVALLADSRRRTDIFLLLGLLLGFSWAYSVYGVFSRYNEPFMPFIYVGIVGMIASLYTFFRGGHTNSAKYDKPIFKQGWNWRDF
jgi:hypothetical protein